MKTPNKKSAPPPPPAKTILLIEDDDSLRKLVERILVKAGYKVISAQDSVEATALVEGEKATVDLILADILLPGLSGPEFALELRDRNPKLKVIFVTGSDDPNVLGTVKLVKHERFLPKPYVRETILAAVREALK